MRMLRDPHARTEIPAQRAEFLPNPHLEERHDDVLEPLGAHS